MSKRFTCHNISGRISTNNVSLLLKIVEYMLKTTFYFFYFCLFAKMNLFMTVRKECNDIFTFVFFAFAVWNYMVKFKTCCFIFLFKWFWFCAKFILTPVICSQQNPLFYIVIKWQSSLYNYLFFLFFASSFASFCAKFSASCSILLILPYLLLDKVMSCLFV